MSKLVLSLIEEKDDLNDELEEIITSAFTLKQLYISNLTSNFRYKIGYFVIEVIIFFILHSLTHITFLIKLSI